MKPKHYYKVLLAFICLLFTSQQFVNAQCTLSNTGVKLNSVTSEGSFCIVNFDFKFDVNKNNGFKNSYFHFWESGKMPTDLDVNKTSKGPKKSDLGIDLLATIRLDWTDDGVPSLETIYIPDTEISPLPSSGMTLNYVIVGNIVTVTISNISFSIPGSCDDIPDLEAASWGTQTDNKTSPIHCGTKGIKLTLDDPKANGSINCNEPNGPRTYNVNITTSNTAELPISYKVYLDDGVLTGGVPTYGPGDTEVYSSGPMTITSATPINLTNQTYTYARGEDTRYLWVVVSGVDGSIPNSIIAELSNNCTAVALPVTLTQFKGDLLDNRISLSWNTADERGSQYFGIERSSDSKEFVKLGKVEASGNSNAIKHYNFADINPSTGINYYRLKLVDMDGTFDYSRVIAINNDQESLSFELLGNPTTSKEIKLLLKNGDTKALSLTNMNGQKLMFRLSQNGSEYTLIPNQQLASGLYLISLVNQNQIITKKILINQ